MTDFKDWPFVGRVIGALTLICVLVGPLIVSAYSLGSTAARLKNQEERREAQFADTTRRLQALSDDQDRVSAKLEQQSDLLLRAGYENASRFLDLERRMSILEASRVAEPR